MYVRNNFRTIPLVMAMKPRNHAHSWVSVVQSRANAICTSMPVSQPYASPNDPSSSSSVSLPFRDTMDSQTLPYSSSASAQGTIAAPSPSQHIPVSSRVPIHSDSRKVSDKTVASVSSGTFLTRDLFWQKVPQWQDITEQEFLSHRWQVRSHITLLIKLS